MDTEATQGKGVNRSPLAADGLLPDRVRQEQLLRFPEMFQEALDMDSDYEVHEGLLYSKHTPFPLAASYPRLVLPPCFRPAAIKRAHLAVGHMGAQKTMQRTTDAYVWPGMKAEIKRFTQNCPTSGMGFLRIWRENRTFRGCHCHSCD